MHLALRSPLATLVPLLLLVPVAALSGGCASGTDVEDGGPTVTATGPSDPTTEPTTEPPTSSTTDDAASTAPDLPDAVAAVCGPYAVMARAIKSVAFGGADPDEVAAALAPVMKRFAARVPELEQPPGVSPEVWRGIEVLAVRILGLPDRPTYAEIEAVGAELSERERDEVEAAAAWFRTTCPV